MDIAERIKNDSNGSCTLKTTILFGKLKKWTIKVDNLQVLRMWNTNERGHSMRFQILIIHKLLLPLFCIFLFSPSYALDAAEIRPKAGGGLSNTFAWDGKELKPKSGATLERTWTFNGKELKPKSKATLRNTYTWNGKELKAKSGASLSNTFAWNGKELKPKSGATLKNTWVYERGEWRQKSGATMGNTWVVTGSIPTPVCALVILGFVR